MVLARSEKGGSVTAVCRHRYETNAIYITRNWKSAERYVGHYRTAWAVPGLS